MLFRSLFDLENWWRWIKGVFKIKEPIARNENGLQVQIITALIADLLFKVFKKVGNFPGTLYEFVVRCQEMSLVPWSNLADGPLRRALEIIYFDLLALKILSQSTRAA